MVKSTAAMETNPGEPPQWASGKAGNSWDTPDQIREGAATRNRTLGTGGMKGWEILSPSTLQGSH